MDNVLPVPQAAPWPELDQVVQQPWDGLMQHVKTPPLMVELASASLTVQEFNPRELSEKVALDAVLAGRLLAVVNSAKFGLAEPMTSIHRALVHLGFNLVKSIITSYMLENSFSGSLPVPPAHLTYVRHWSALASVVTYHWARAAELPDPSTAATVALLARTGTLVLGLVSPAPGEDYWEAPNQQVRLALEEAVWGITTPALSYRLTQIWGIPDPIPTLLGQHLAAILRLVRADPAGRLLSIVTGGLVLAERHLHHPQTDCLAVLDSRDYVILKQNLAEHRLLESLGTTWASARLQREMAGVLMA